VPAARAGARDQENSLEALQSATAPDARSVVLELDEADSLDGTGAPGGEFIAEELTVQVIPQAEDEFTCYSCLLVRHRSQIARQRTATYTAPTVKAEPARASQPTHEYASAWDVVINTAGETVDSEPVQPGETLEAPARSLTVLRAHTTPEVEPDLSVSASLAVRAGTGSKTAADTATTS
jgi:Domain of unknown function (DUF4193)